MNSSVDLTMLAFVKRGRQRRLALKHLSEKPTMVSELQHKINNEIKITGDGKEIRLSDTSRTLKSLVDAGLVECLNPRQRIGEKGILYRLTPSGVNMQASL